MIHILHTHIVYVRTYTYIVIYFCIYLFIYLYVTIYKHPFWCCITLGWCECTGSCATRGWKLWHNSCSYAESPLLCCHSNGRMCRIRNELCDM